MGYTRIDELSKEKRKEFEDKVTEYVRVIRSLGNFFNENNIDSEKEWSKAKEILDENAKKTGGNKK